MTFSEYQNITIMVGGAVGFSAVVSRNLHVTVTLVTEKAIRVTSDDNNHLWLPKKVLTPSTLDNNLFKLARWFTPDNYQQSFINKYQTCNGQSSA